MMARIARLFVRFISKVSTDIPASDREPLPESERPECPHCGRRLGVAPGHNGLAWKCPAHGTFPAYEFEPNILRAMQTDENT